MNTYIKRFISSDNEWEPKSKTIDRISKDTEWIKDARTKEYHVRTMVPNVSYLITKEFKRDVKSYYEVFKEKKIDPTNYATESEYDIIFSIGKKFYTSKFSLYTTLKLELFYYYAGEKSIFKTLIKKPKLVAKLVVCAIGKYRKHYNDFIRKYCQKNLKYTDLSDVNRKYFNKIMENINYKRKSKDSFKWLTNPNVQKKIISIFDCIENIASRRSYYAMIAGIYKIINGDIYKKFRAITDKLSVEVNKVNTKQTMSKARKTNYVTEEEIIRMRDKLGELDAHKSTRKRHYQYLMLCLTTMNEPLRSEYKDMEIVSMRGKIKNKKKNYIIVGQKSVSFSIGDDKVVGSHGIELIPISNTKLMNIVRQSLRKYPRKYLFTQLADSNKPLGMQYFRLLDGVFEPKKVSVDILRSAYITDAFTRDLTLTGRKKICQRMRTSFQMALHNYEKTKITKTFKKQLKTVVNKNIKKLENPKPKTVVKQNPKKPDPKADTKAKRKAERKAELNKLYYENHKKEMKERQKVNYEKDKDDKRRKKVLYDIKVGKTKKPTQATINKYDLKYNTKTKTWS